MIDPKHFAYLMHVRMEFDEKKPWHPAHTERQWKQYLLEEYRLIIRYDHMRGEWLDFGTHAAEDRFKLLSEQHRMWKALTEEQDNLVFR